MMESNNYTEVGGIGFIWATLVLILFALAVIGGELDGIRKALESKSPRSMEAGK